MDNNKLSFIIITFAPTVIAEEQFKYFDLNCSSDYMLLATTVKKEYRTALASITHVDNTARIQASLKKITQLFKAILQIPVNSRF